MPNNFCSDRNIVSLNITVYVLIALKQFNLWELHDLDFLLKILYLTQFNDI